MADTELPVNPRALYPVIGKNLPIIRKQPGSGTMMSLFAEQAWYFMQATDDLYSEYSDDYIEGNPRRGGLVDE